MTVEITRREALRFAAIGSAAGLVALEGCKPAAVAVVEGHSEPQKPPFRILSCDGGGIRGLLTARIVQKLQQELGMSKDGKGQPLDFQERTHCFAGTSTGGIIALGLASRLSPDKLVDIYRVKGSEVFKEFKLGGVESTAIDGLKTVIRPLERYTAEGLADKTDHLFCVCYSSDGLRDILNKTLEGEEQTLETVGKHKAVVVTTMQLNHKDHGWRPVVLHNLPTKEADDPDGVIGKKTTVLDAALCTSAAPIYFAPHKHPELGFCADGGLFANNPGMAALVKAKQAGHDNVRLLSIGTGSTVNRMKVPPFVYFLDSQNTRCGILAWLCPTSVRDVPAFPLLAAMFDAGAASDALYCGSLLGSAGYRRIQITLDKDVPMDGYQKKHVDYLEEHAEKYFKDKRWDEDKKWIIENYLA